MIRTHRYAADFAPRHLAVLYRCSNHFLAGGWGDIHHCPVLQPRPGGECWSCRQPECRTWMSKYRERDV